MRRSASTLFEREKPLNIFFTSVLFSFVYIDMLLTKLDMREQIFVRIVVREVSLYRVVTCLCTHCAWCVAPRCFQLLQTYVRIEGTHTIAAVSPTKFLTPEDGHIGLNM
jgi:hypothetical protein